MWRIEFQFITLYLSIKESQIWFENLFWRINETDHIHQELILTDLFWIINSEEIIESGPSTHLLKKSQPSIRWGEPDEVTVRLVDKESALNQSILPTT